jgi:hypothetical protein
MQKIILRNEAYKGFRLVTEPIKEGNKEYVYTIGWHHVLHKFYLEECITHFNFKPPLTVSNIVYSNSVEVLIREIEKRRRAKVYAREAIDAEEFYETH